MRVVNGLAPFGVRGRVSPPVKPGRLVSYHGRASFRCRNSSGANELEPGMVKEIGSAGGYGHIQHPAAEWEPIPSDRRVRPRFREGPIPRRGLAGLACQRSGHPVPGPILPSRKSRRPATVALARSGRPARSHNAIRATRVAR